MSEDLLLLSGANGRTGRAILKAMVSRGIRVRAFIRDAGQASELEALGAAECFVGDMTDAQSMEAAVQGCTKLLHIGPPMHPEEIEITQRFIDAAKKADLDHFIYYSVMHPLRRDVRHHRLKLECEEALVESGLQYTILQPGRYMQHFVPQWPNILEKGVITMPFSTQQEFSIVDLADLAEAAAVVASSNEHHYATYELSGPELLSHDNIAEIMSKALDRPVRAEQVSLDAMADKARAAGANEDRIGQMVAMNGHYDRHGFRGNSNVLQMLLGRPATRLKSYVQDLADKG